MRTRLRLPLAAATLSALLLTSCSGSSEEDFMASARGYMARHEYGAAVIELKRALDNNGNSGQVRRLLGKALLEAGDPAGAEVELSRALELGASDGLLLADLARSMLVLGQAPKVIARFGGETPRDAAAQAELRTWVAAAHAQLGNLPKANEELALALRAQPLYPAALMVQARLQAAAGDIDGALRQLDTVLANDPGNEHAGVAKGYVLWLGRHDAAGALEAYRKVLAAKPGSAAAQAEIVTILFSQGKAEEARQAFEELKRMAPAHPETVFFDAQFAYVDGQYRRSRELSDALLKVVPDHVRALELAAAAEFRLGNDEQVQAFIARALKVQPGLRLSRQILARSFLRAGEPAKAIVALEPLLEGDDADAESLVLAGGAYLLAGDASKADDAFKKATRLAPASAKVRTELAMAMLGGGRSEVAMRELQAVAATDRNPRADLALVSTLIARKELRPALKAIDGLEAKMPGHPLPDQLRGQVQVALRDAAAARRSFEAALAKSARYLPAVAALASMEVASGKPELARKRLTDYLAEVPSSSQAMMLLADIPDAGGGPAPDAVQRLTDATRASPGDRQVHLALITRHLQAGDRPSALAAAQAANAAMPSDVAILDALGQTQLLAGDAQQAVSTFRKLAGLQPRGLQSRMSLAEAHVALKEYDAAGRALKEAIDIDPRHGPAHRGLAMLALRENRVADALAIARDMQKLQPKVALGYAVEGDVETQRRNWTAAASAYRSALQLSGATEAAIKLYTVLGAAGRQGEANQLAADWEKKRPNDPAFRFHLGDEATRKDDFAAAERHYRAVLVTQPRNALAMNNIAWLMHRQRKPGALQMAEKANALLPNRAPILDTLALLQEAAGHVVDAVATQRKALAASPQDPNLKLELARYLVKAGQHDEARVLLGELGKLGDRFPRQAEASALLRSM